MILTIQVHGLGFAEHELAPLAAAYLGARLFAAAVEITTEDNALGAPVEDMAPVTVWTQPEPGGWWTPTPVISVWQLKRHVTKAKKEGVPYRVTAEIIQDPLTEPEPKEDYNV